MREIIFRGKRTDDGEWIEGDYAYSNIENKYFIICNPEMQSFTDPGNYLYTIDCCEIIPETVGQFTGLTDKNGIKIFEGDIVKGTFLGFPIPIEDDVFSICWQEDIAGYKANYFENVEVIGNIYDNPELLETDK